MTNREADMDRALEGEMEDVATGERFAVSMVIGEAESPKPEPEPEPPAPPSEDPREPREVTVKDDVYTPDLTEQWNANLNSDHDFTLMPPACPPGQSGTIMVFGEGVVTLHPDWVLVGADQNSIQKMPVQIPYYSPRKDQVTGALLRSENGTHG